MRVLEQTAVGAGDLRHRVPVALLSICGDEAVRDEELVRAIIVEITELRAPRPARVGDRSFGNIAKATRVGHLVQPQVVVLKEVTTLGDVRYERIQPAAIERVA